jgi:hypothetical protein
VKPTTGFHPELRLKICGAFIPIPPYVGMALCFVAGSRSLEELQAESWLGLLQALDVVTTFS